MLSLFSVTVFIVVFREAIEAVIIISVLLGLVTQLVHEQASLNPSVHAPPGPADNTRGENPSAFTPAATRDPESDAATRAPRILKKLRLQVLLGSFVGLAIAVTVGATFIAIWFTQARDLWSQSEQLWEGTFELVASLMVLVMGVTLLKMENARTKWRIKLQNAFDGRQDRSSKAGRWALFLLPLITVLREGVEAIIFVGGVALGQPATSVPIAAIIGIICGLVCGFLIYHFASRTTLKVFLVCMANLLLLIGAGLFSKAVWAYQINAFYQMLGVNGDDALGTGPGTYDVRGNVWYLDCCSATANGSWSLFNAILGWQNDATLGSVLSYVFYWLVVIAILIYFKFKEGRTTIFGWESANGKQKREKREGQGRSDSPEKLGHEMAPWSPPDSPSRS